MKQKEIHEVAIQMLDGNNPLVDYSDGDVVIIDNVRQLSEVNPMRMGMIFIILCCEGRIQVDINGRQLRMGKNEVLFSAPNVVLDNFLFSADFECKILCLSERIIQGLLHEKTDLWNKAVYVRKMNLVRLPDDDVETFDLYYALLLRKLRQDGRAYRTDAVRSLVSSLLLELCSVLKEHIGETEGKPSQGRLLFDRFLALLSAAPVKRCPVGHYAYELAVTSKYLTMVCEQHSGKAASDWINQYVMEDIRYHLRNTTLPIKEIADRLGFANISHFGTYVRRHFGMSPSRFRIEARNT